MKEREEGGGSTCGQDAASDLQEAHFHRFFALPTVRETCKLEEAGVDFSVASMLPERTVMVVGRGLGKVGFSRFLWSLGGRHGGAEVRKWWVPQSQVRLKAHLPNPEGLLLPLLSLMLH